MKHDLRQAHPVLNVGEGSIVEPEAFEAAFNENFQAVHRFLARRVGGALADELAADTFAVAYRRRAAFDPSRGELRAWLLGIAARLLRAHWREEQRLLKLEARVPIEPKDSASHPEEAAMAAMLAPRVASALARLPKRQREVLLLHAWGELSSEEIAAALGLRAVTVRVRLARARTRLRESLGDLDPHPQLSKRGSAPTHNGGIRNERA